MIKLNAIFTFVETFLLADVLGHELLQEKE